MLAVQKWAEDKPYLLALAGPQLATTAQDLHLAFREIKDRRLLDHQFPLPHLPSWFRLYRSHQKTNQFLKILFSEFSPFSQDSVEFGESMIEFTRISNQIGINKIRDELTQLAPEETKEILQKSKELWDNMLKESYMDIQNDIKGEPVPNGVRENLLSMFSEESQEATFFLLVYAPCWVLYRDSPTRLYRKARQGQYEAIEKILRLDALMIHDPFIGKQIQKLRMNRRWNAYEDLILSVLKKPKARITRKKMKYAMAGFISALSIILKHPLTAPEIKDLFDAVAQDFQKQDIDTDIPDSPEAFAKAIQRDREFWQHLFTPDKKN